MIGWLNPSALAALALVVAPVLIHLLRTERARRRMFPTLRFVRQARSASVRPRWPTDSLLLILRVGIVAVAVLAAARPIALTRGRVDQWNARMARAVVVDTSASMRMAGGSGITPASLASEAAEAEMRTAFRSARFDVPVLGEGLVRAASWLANAPPARREIVVISDFQRDALCAEDVNVLPAGAGLRFVPVGGPGPQRRTIAGLSLLGADGVAPRAQQVELSGPGSSVTIERSTAEMSGLRVLGADPTPLRSILRAVAAAGASAPAADEPIVVQFAGTSSSEQRIVPAPVQTRTPAWMVKALLRLTQDRELIAISHVSTAIQTTPAGEWTIVTRDRAGRPLVRAAPGNESLVLDIASPPNSYVAAAALRAILSARHGPIAQAEQEPLRIDPSQLAAWSRVSGPVDPDAWRQSDATDARWLWVLALAALAVEHLIRRRSRLQTEVQVAAA